MTFWGLDVFTVALLFARVGAMVMLLPGFGETNVPANVRLPFALALALVLAPLLAPSLPKAPDQLGASAVLLTGEMVVGLMFGSLARILVGALETAGQIVGLETGLSYAQTADPTQGQAGQVVAVFLNLLGVTLIFVTGLYREFIGAIVGSYQVFHVGVWPTTGDALEAALRTFGDSFRIGVQIAAPLMLAGIVFRLGLGVLNRLIPQIQVFFVAMPANVLGGFIIFALALSTGMLLWLDRLQSFARTLG